MNVTMLSHIRNPSTRFAVSPFYIPMYLEHLDDLPQFKFLVSFSSERTKERLSDLTESGAQAPTHLTTSIQLECVRPVACLIGHSNAIVSVSNLSVFRYHLIPGRYPRRATAHGLCTNAKRIRNRGFWRCHTGQNVVIWWTKRQSHVCRQ